MNVTVDELIIEIGRLHIQVLVLQKQLAEAQAQVPPTPEMVKAQ